MITVKQFAELLNGRQYGNEMTKEEKILAKQNGIVVVYGYSDDNMEFEGTISEEVGCYSGGEFWFTKDGKFPDDEQLEVLKDFECTPKNKINAIWCPKDENGKVICSWKYETFIPHETFKIMGDEDIYCIGIVFHISSLH